MIVYFLGIPGSGKTYYGVNAIYDNFAKDIPKKSKLSLKKDYENCYTNINEFNYDFTNNVHKFDFDDFYNKLKILYCMYNGLSLDTAIELEPKVDLESSNIDKRSLTLEQIKSLRESINKPEKKEKLKKASDAELIEKAKELNIYKSLFVIDECHNFFDTVDKVKIWWLTYHRHLYHDVYLITQSLSLVHSKYKPLAEAFYKAKSASLTLNKRYFNYMYYIDSRMSKESFVSTLKVPKRQEVFKLYKSGDSVETKNVILKFIYIALALFVVLFSLVYFFYYEKTSSLSASKNIEISKITTVSNSVQYNSDNEIDIDNFVFMEIQCNNLMCSYKNYYFDVKLLSYAKEHFDLEIINTIKLFKSEKISISVNISFLNFIKGGLRENNIQQSDIVSDSFNVFKSK